MMTKHFKHVWVYRDAGAVVAEFDTIQECGVFEGETLLDLREMVRAQELRALDHKNVKPEN